MIKRRSIRTQPRAFVIADAIMAMCILGVLLSTMAIGLTAHQRAAVRLANSRDAINAAESALCDLQQGKPAVPQNPVDHLQIDRLPGGTAVAGFTWVRVTASVAGHSESLTGLAKTTTLKGG